MSSNGIKDRVAIVGMSCTPFREHFDRGRDDLLIDAADEVLASIGVSKQDIDAYWMGMADLGQLRDRARIGTQARRQAGDPRRELLRHRVRGAATSGLRRRQWRLRRRNGHRLRQVQGHGLRRTNASLPPNDGTARTLTAAAMYSMILPAYAKKYGVDPTELRTCGCQDRREEPSKRCPQPLGAVRRRRRQRTFARWRRSPGNSRVRLRRRG